MLGEKFLGFQMHEWLSNYRSDDSDKLGDLPAEEWTKERRAPYKDVYSIAALMTALTFLVFLSQIGLFFVDKLEDWMQIAVRLITKGVSLGAEILSCINCLFLALFAHTLSRDLRTNAGKKSATTVILNISAIVYVLTAIACGVAQFVKLPVSTLVIMLPANFILLGAAYKPTENMKKY